MVALLTQKEDENLFGSRFFKRFDRFSHQDFLLFLWSSVSFCRRLGSKLVQKRYTFVLSWPYEILKFVVWFDRKKRLDVSALEELDRAYAQTNSTLFIRQVLCTKRYFVRAVK